MKYPNDFVRERNGYAPGSQGDRDALARVNAPFLTKESPNTRTYKKGDFFESEVVAGEPRLIGTILLNDGSLHHALIDIDGEGISVKAQPTRVYKLGANAAAITLARHPYAGDGYVLMMYSNDNDANGEAVVHWPVLVQTRNGIGQQYLFDDPAKTRKATSFVDEVAISGLLTELHTLGFTCSGWGGTAKRFRFGVAFTYYVDPTSSATRNATRAGVFLFGDTASQSLAVSYPPATASRNNIAFVPFVVGPGKLRALHIVEEDETGVLAKIAPTLDNSTDHGETWSSSAAAFLTPYLFEHPIVGPVRAYYENDQLGGLAFSSVIVYLGGGASMLIIPNGYDSGAAKYFPMAFLDTGGGYTRVAWPPDAWEVSANGSSLGTSYLRFFGYTNDLKSCQFGFGDGCMYMPVRSAGENKLLFTRDYGSTWQFSAALPGLMATNYFTNFGTVMSPYVDATRKGEIIFARPDYTTQKIDFYRTNGDFATFTKIPGTLVPKGTGMDSTSTPDFNVFFTNMGNTERTAPVWPAYPTEFNA